ncbi:polysaccharide deacetylase family protein [Serpentinicella alkaliphila]|uniref:Polysaccharide deacetylase family sporulation protein PdaB n=1 Tax=Serpentinicella alkaliphila TaxID=1734049 RepID=A0A4R2T2A8_9FIRM|nr:polysaccharide deacetylase family protein [Serpentinicella alkaliphila]QUH25847.1 polysaccharide deacetylase family protein [Serpentinicella alkaliphila]TCP95306.1 polysaccharide deacetylase family sporulation protein PdaB [Serpentinicella alkaliphila]
MGKLILQIYKNKVFISMVVLSILVITYYVQIEQRLMKEVNQINYSDLNIVRNGDENQKIIALTFDDGPHPRFTPQILDLLKEYDAKGTFFVLGKHVKVYPEVVERIKIEGHEVGNHTYTHIDVTKSSYWKIKKEFEDTQNIIYSVTGSKPNIFRPPFGFINNAALHIVQEGGSRIILWSPNQDPNDWRSPGIDSIVKHVLSNIENGNIILLHDYIPEKNSHTVEALKRILPELTKEGYRFVTINELIEISNLELIKVIQSN